MKFKEIPHLHSSVVIVFSYFGKNLILKISCGVAFCHAEKF